MCGPGNWSGLKEMTRHVLYNTSLVSVRVNCAKWCVETYVSRDIRLVDSATPHSIGVKKRYLPVT